MTNIVPDIKRGGELENVNDVKRLLAEINEGFRSGEEYGWLSDEDIGQHFTRKRDLLAEQ